MSTKRNGKGRRGRAARRGLSIESLERRALLSTASETFSGPSLAGLITQANHGKDTSQAQVNLMVTALRSQLESGPLHDFTSGSSGNVFIAESQALEASFEQNADKQLSPKYLDTDELIKLQGQSVVASLVALNQQESVGLISVAQQVSASEAAITSLKGGPIQAFNTKPAALTSAARTLTSELNALTAGLGHSLTLAQVDNTLDAEAEAFRAQVHAGIQRTQLAISGHADTAINALESAANGIAQTNPSDALARLSTAINTFDSAILGTKGLFAAHGALAKAKTPKLHRGQTTGQAVSLLTDVSATAINGGTSTLTATLTQANDSPLAGQSVAFTIDGAFAGVAVTNFVGVATLIGVPTTAGVGTDAQGVATSYLGSTNFLPAAASGNLVVSQSLTTMTNVSGTATFGGTASLQATLTSPTTSLGLAGQTVTFFIDGNVVGTAITNANGLATLSGVPTTDAAGTDPNGVIANFGGTATLASAAASGNLVVGPAGTVLTSVSGTAATGGTATLTATLLSSVTNQGASGQTVNFYLDNTAVGTAVTNSNGIATLTGVTTSDALGTDTGGIVVNFSGSTNYAASANATGNLVVGKADTELGNVSGTASFGGTATLTATLNSAVTTQPLAGKTVNFTLDGKAVGSAVTTSAGVATLTGVTTAFAPGTDTNGVVATFAGDSSDNSTTTTGNLAVSQAATSLGGVTGTSSFGGPATLTATLTSTVTNQPVAGQTVSFTLSGNSVGTAVTNASGVATLTGVTASVAAGTQTGVVVAKFSGSTDYAASPDFTGNLIVSPAATTLSSVAGTATFGSDAELKATLMSSVTGKGIAGETVHFTLDGASAGSGVTDSNGVATLTAVNTSQGVGTDTGGVLASFTGDANYSAALNTSGNLVVGQDVTGFSTVSGTAPSGGPATLTAKLISTITNLPLAGLTVSFTLDGKAAGTAVTNAVGMATVTEVPTTDTVGTHTGAVVVNYAGDSNHKAGTGTGDLVVS